MPIKKLTDIGKQVRNRDQLILEAVRNRRTVHLGCAGDSPDIIDRRIRNGNYLHQQISAASEWCVGIELNRPIVEHLKKAHAIENIYFGNAEDSASWECPVVRLREADVVVIPDVIEHLSNPGRMLESLKNSFSNEIKIIVTTPNPFTYENFLRTLRGEEVYNSYHSCYFSVQNMRTLATREGFQVTRIEPFWVSDRGKVRRFAPFGLRGVGSWMGNALFLASRHFCDGYFFELTVA